jgi:hypothetical protein
MSFIARFAKQVWSELFGPIPQPYRAHLRPRAGLKKPRWLPTTPIKSHQAPTVRERTETDVTSRKCPHCKGNINVNFNSGRVSKPTPRKKAGKAERWIKLPAYMDENGDEYLIEDLSPTRSLRSTRKVRYY